MNLIGIKDIYQFEDLQPIINGFLYKNTLNLLTGYAGVGKSLFALSIAKAIILGESFLGRQTKLKGNVLYIDEENPKPYLKDRILKLDIPIDSPLYFLHYQQLKIDNDNHIKNLLAIINKIKPALVIFDSLIRLHSASENDNTAMANIMNKFREVMQYTDTTILLLHHDRKSLGSVKEKARGAGDIIGSVDNQFNIVSSEENLTLYTGKTRHLPIKPIKFKFIVGDKIKFQNLSGGEN